MEKTPIQNVIDKIDNLRKEFNSSPTEKRIFYLVISSLWDELDGEREVFTKIFDSGKNGEDMSGKIWVNENFIDYQKIL